MYRALRVDDEQVKSLWVCLDGQSSKEDIIGCDCYRLEGNPDFQKGLEGHRELLASQPHLNPWKDDGAPHSGGHFFHMDDRNVIRSSQHEFTKGKSCLTNLIAFYNEMTVWMNEWRAVDIACLDFRKSFGAVSHNVLIGKLSKDNGIEDQVSREHVCVNLPKEI
ncbi:hypothetical protein DUI87_20423 [Hirundo rustica rustica]|uniref:Reverse transcriptase domain-containing protein n=1 Tax=Hirundo rustica rustica TaxID=333673 RepID=A0A3M0JQW3_HIRRU|nr:hypothetical protein DUI87_20423 [Hirundo rustica rustica]